MHTIKTGHNIKITGKEVHKRTAFQCSFDNSIRLRKLLNVKLKTSLIGYLPLIGITSAQMHKAVKMLCSDLAGSKLFQHCTKNIEN